MGQSQSTSDTSVDGIRLVVIHNRSSSPDMRTFCNAVQTKPPPGSLGDVVDDRYYNAHLSQSTKNDFKQWTSEWTRRGGIVLLCLLADHNDQELNAHIKGNDRIIEFCFRHPPVNGLKPIMINVDFDTASRQDFIANMDRLAAKIRELR